MSIKVTSAKSLETAIKNFKVPEKYPDYEIRHDFHQSQNSITVAFYVKCIVADTFKISLTSSNSLVYITSNIDNGFRKMIINLELPAPASSISKCMLTGTK